MKKLALFLSIVFHLGCNSQIIKISGKEEIVLEQKEFSRLLQESFNLYKIDNFYKEEEKENGLIIVINDFIKPYYKDLSLYKFNKEVKFKSHREIFIEKNKKFVDIMKPFKVNDTLHITYGLRYKNYAVIAKFIRKNKIWHLITKDHKSKDIPKGIYNFKTDKEQCLVQQIESTIFGMIEKCSKYDFTK
ncbi:hypothetical protein [Aquimarina algiphila]|uniref:hypothetical protein n=1 Tax=Aquimarina algiphila TaxID=2047982 RepID=UPI00232F99EE|nr:hypothetical protein [Aquimarina algiphila]